MDKKSELKNYLNFMYEFYKNSNYNYFVEKCLNYNIKINDYNKNIDKLSKNIFLMLLDNVDKSISKIKYNECRFYYNLSIFHSDNVNYNSSIILDIPVFEDNYEKIALNLFNYFIENSFDFTMKFYKILKNDYFKVVLYNINDCKKFIEYFASNKEIKEQVKSRVLPFLYSINLLGIYTEIYPYSFKNFFIKYLYLYFSSLNNELDEDFDILNGFYIFIKNKWKKEEKLNKKRMFFIIYNYLNIIINDLSIFDLFDLKLSVDIGSYNSNNYSLRLDKTNNIYFKDNLDYSEVRFGSIEFLGICYSKYYEKIIKQNTLNTFFSNYYSIYSDILSTNYKNIDNILSLINSDMDVITKQLIIFSSAYYAYIMFEFSLKDLYMLLKIVLIKINIYYEDNTSNKNAINKVNYILEEDYANVVVSLSDKTSMSIGEYFNKFRVLKTIDCNSVIHFKDNYSLRGDEFLDNLYKFIPKYSNFKELLSDLVYFIEYK